jgi:hypothetical protein
VRKPIAVVALCGLSLLLAAIPGYAYCTAAQINACNDQNNVCTSACNFAGAPQSCYANCVCKYDKCLQACGDVSVPNCPPQTVPRDESAGPGGEDLSFLFSLETPFAIATPVSPSR